MSRIIKFIMLSIIVALGFSLKSYAAEKEIKVDLSEGYSQANFYFAFETDQNYDITIINPAEQPIKYTVIGNMGTVTLDNIIAGTYCIKVNADNEIVFSSAPRVELLKNQADTVHGNISVSSRVTGLKIWFEDGVLKAKWDDTNIGRVNIQIMNPSTMEVLTNSSVDGTEYSYKVAADINNINFYIVPASSSRIEGAGESYAVKVIKKVPGEIIFDDKTLFNSSIYSFKAQLFGNTKIVVTENGNEVYSQTFEKSGDYDIEVPLNDLDNNIIVNVIDQNDNLNSYKITVSKDIMAPKFNIQSIDNITKKANVEIIGVVTETDVVEINGYEIHTNQNGQFQYTFPLEIGDNNIKIVARDEAENETVVEYLVTRVKVNYMPLIVIVVLFFLGIPGFFIYRKFVNQIKNKEIEIKPNVQEEKAVEKKIELKKTAVKTKKVVKKSVATPEDNKEPLPFNLIVKRNNNQVRGNLIALGVFAVCLILTFTKVIMFTTVLSGSMEPTLKTGDKVLYNRLAYVNHAIARGDIVCFYSDEYKEYFGKRVIGIAGDEISFADGFLLVNGEKVIESYLDEDVESNSTKTFVVPEGTVFLLGDNRDNSNDSRLWNNPYIQVNKIKGKYIGKFSKE